MCKILKYNDDKLQKILKWFTLFYECSCELLSNGDLLFKWNFEFLINTAISSSMREQCDILSKFLSLPPKQQHVKEIFRLK